MGEAQQAALGEIQVEAVAPKVSAPGRCTGVGLVVGTAGQGMKVNERADAGPVETAAQILDVGPGGYIDLRWIAGKGGVGTELGAEGKVTDWKADGIAASVIGEKFDIAVRQGRGPVILPFVPCLVDASDSY